jgi:hypothetical protein
MFARIVSMPLKADSTSQFTRTIENDVIPLLRKHKGFLDEIALVTSDGKTGIGISFWDTKESAEAYNRSGYGEVLKALATVTSGPTQLQLCNVTHSTTHKIAAVGAA